MDERSAQRRSGRPGVHDTWRLILLIVTVIAVVKELRKPAEERTWHGKVADFVPYDFRKPTAERLRRTYWNPEGPILSGKVCGVGWAPNVGVVMRLRRRSSSVSG